MKVPVISSRISEVEYIKEKKTLVVYFKKGGTYEYWPLEEDIFLALTKASSPGNYFENNIKKNPRLSTFKRPEN